MLNKAFIKKATDCITILIMLGAFALAMYFGFIKKVAGEPQLSSNILAAITLVGFALLLFAGSASALFGRIKHDMMTRLFAWGFAAQIAAYIGLCAVMFCILAGFLEKGIDTPLLRELYILFAVVLVAGYAEAVLVSEPMIDAKQDEADAAKLDEDEGDDEEEVTEEEYDSEEAADSDPDEEEEA